MKNLKSKSKVLTIALVLTLTMTALLTCMTITEAQVIWPRRETFACLSIVPDPVGVGQTVLINGWITPPPDLGGDGLPIVYENIYVTVTKPDDSIDTLGPITSDGPGTVWVNYVPSMAGDYEVVLTWDSVHPAIYEDRRYPVESPATVFTAQSEPVPPAFEDAPLPEGFWTRPINSEFRSWYQISGNWLGGSWAQHDIADTCFNPYSEAPDSAHIIWVKDTRISGLTGGEMGDLFYSSGGAEAVIVAGRALYTDANGIHCVDVKTGEEYWVTPGGGQLIAQPIVNGPLLWALSRSTSAVTIRIYNVYTGALTRTITGDGARGGLYAGIEVVSPTEMYIYMNTHNSVDFTSIFKLDMFASGDTLEDITVWNTQVNNLDHFPTVAEGTVVMQWQSPYLYALDADTGALKWNVTQSINAQMRGSAGYGNTYQPYYDRTIKAYDLQTGALKWESVPADYPWGQFYSYAIGVAYDRIYCTSYDGHIYCYDAHNGNRLWRYYSGDTSETPYGTWPFYGKPAVADGKVFAGTTEHTPTNPFLRGFRMYAVDAFDGTFIWSISGAYGSSSIADGVLITSNQYTGQMYAFTKGQTSTTVSASPKVVAKGSSLIVEGSVMDLSPAQPNTPAISDESMSAWMEYLHMQYPMPEDATGVDVKLTAVDPNGNMEDIGMVTSDMSGHYGKMWTPKMEGQYTIIANFEGSNSYYSSYAVTTIGVGPAVEPAGPIEPEPTPEPTEAPLISTEVAIIAAVAVVAVVAIVAYWALRRRQ